ncbi:MotA/TolQ/ExbB proton channel family protein [Phycisphaeraceae bacterium D3-23]
MPVSDLDTQTRGRRSGRPTFRLVAMVTMFFIIAAATLATTGPASGQDDTTPANPAQPQTQSAPGATDSLSGGDADANLSKKPLYRISQLYGFSPIINGIIIALSVLAVMFFVWFMLTINNRTMAPPGLVDEVVKLILRGDYERAGDVCRRSRGVFVADIVLRCVENAGQQHGIMLDMIDVEGRRLADVLWNRISYLADISNVAPMLGLLGTVLGMIKVFSELEITSGSISAQLLAGGVGEAMSTTMFGLSVGIFVTVLYAVVKSRATRTLADAEQAVHMIADHIKRDEVEPPTPRKPKAKQPRRRASDKIDQALED